MKKERESTPCHVPSFTKTTHLLVLLLAEKLDSLNRVTAISPRLGSSIPLRPDSSDSAFVCRLIRLAATMAVLYAEIDALADLEQSVREMPTDEARRHNVWRLCDASH